MPGVAVIVPVIIDIVPRPPINQSFPLVPPTESCLPGEDYPQYLQVIKATDAFGKQNSTFGGQPT